jgi:hypothetical protein
VRQEPAEQEQDAQGQPGNFGAAAPQPLSRRHFLGAGSAAAVTALATTAVAATAHTPRQAGSTVASERVMIGQLATAGTLFPVRVPVPGTVTPPRAHVSMAHVRAAHRRLPAGAVRLSDARPPTLTALRAAERATPASRLRSARRGAGLLIGAGLLGSSQVALLSGVGDLAASSAPADQAALLDVTTLAVRTIFPAAAQPQAQDRAAKWLRMLSTMHVQCTLRPALTARGLR